MTTLAVTGDGLHTIAIPAPADGTYTYRSSATDLAGNASADFGALTVRVDRTAPSVTARFTAFALQMAIGVYWAVRLLAG